MNISQWTCPKCGRKFAHPNQWHSCMSVDLDSHFIGKPEVLRGIFDSLVVQLRALGPFTVDAVRSQIILRNKSHFASVKVQKDSLNLGFRSSGVITYPRVLRSEQVAPKIFTTHIKITKVEEIDGILLEWLTTAYHLAS